MVVPSIGSIIPILALSIVLPLVLGPICPCVRYACILRVEPLRALSLLVLFPTLFIILLMRIRRVPGLLANVQPGDLAHRAEHFGVLVVVADRDLPGRHRLRRQGFGQQPPDERDVGVWVARAAGRRLRDV